MQFPVTVSSVSKSLKLPDSSVPLNVLPPPTHIYKYILFLSFIIFGRAPFLDLGNVSLGFLMTVIGSQWVCRWQCW